FNAVIPSPKFAQVSPNLGPRQFAKQIEQIHFVGEKLVAHKAGHHHASPVTARSAVQAMSNVPLDQRCFDGPRLLLGAVKQSGLRDRIPLDRNVIGLLDLYQESSLVSWAPRGRQE